MYRVSSVLLAGIWATALSAQTPPSFFPAPQRLPGVPQFTVMPQAPAIQTDAALRELLKGYSPAETRVCAIPLRVVPVPKNLEQMPVLRPPTDKIDNMPAVKLPAPACDEEKR
jgi:hypothetical protein